MRKFARIIPILAIGLLTLLSNPVEAIACPTCKDGLANHTALGYAISILFMMGMPFLILSFWTITVIRLRRLATESPHEIPSDQFVNQRVIASASSPNFEV